MKTIKTLLAAAALLLAGLTTTQAYIGGPCVTNVTVVMTHYNYQCPFTVTTGDAGTNLWNSTTQTFVGGYTTIWTSGNNFSVGNFCGDTNACTLTLARSGDGPCCSLTGSMVVYVSMCDGTSYNATWSLSYGDYSSTIQFAYNGGAFMICPLYGSYDVRCNQQ